MIGILEYLLYPGFKIILFWFYCCYDVFLSTSIDEVTGIVGTLDQSIYLLLFIIILGLAFSSVTISGSKSSKSLSYSEGASSSDYLALIFLFIVILASTSTFFLNKFLLGPCIRSDSAPRISASCYFSLVLFIDTYSGYWGDGLTT